MQNIKIKLNMGQKLFKKDAQKVGCGEWNAIFELLIRKELSCRS